MALLSKTNREKYLKALGFSDVLSFQKKAFTRSKDKDGVYGTNTDNALRHFYNVYKYTKNFKPEEFKCGCGGKYCTGYPAYMKPEELSHLQTIRTHYGKKMTVTCGLRCKGYNNSLRGSVSNSKHLTGYAADFYIKGVTDTLANRKTSVKYIKGLPNHSYTYGNGINSNGAYVSASNMGNCMHTDCKAGIVSTTKKKYSGSLPNLKVSTKTNEEVIDKGMKWAKKIADDNSYIYKNWESGDNKTHQCPICKNLTGKYKGWNCIGYATAIFYHGMGEKGITCSCSGLCNNAMMEYDSITLDKWKKRNGNDWSLVAKQSSRVPESKLKKGDGVHFYDGKTWKHIGVYYGNGKIIDSRGSGRGIGVRDYSSYKGDHTPKVVFRYTGQKKTVTSVKVLKKGDLRTAEVKKWQEFLNWYMDAGLVEDGIFGSKTASAQKKWQKKNGWKQTGNVGQGSIDRAKVVTK